MKLTEKQKKDIWRKYATDYAGSEKTGFDWWIEQIEQLGEEKEWVQICPRCENNEFKIPEYICTKCKWQDPSCIPKPERIEEIYQSSPGMKDYDIRNAINQIIRKLNNL